MQPNFQTEFQIMTKQKGSTSINPKGGFLKGDNELKGEDECFLGTLNKMERVPDESVMELMKLQEKNQSKENMLGMKINTDSEICSLISDINIRGGNITKILLGPEKYKEENNEKQLGSRITEQELLKDQINGNEKTFRPLGYFANTETENITIDKNGMISVSKSESNSGAKKLVPGEMLNISVKTEENESKTGQGELNKNNAGLQTPKGSEGTVGKEAGVQVAKGLDGTVGKEAGLQVAKGLDGAIGKEAGVQVSKGLEGTFSKESGGQASKESERTVGKETGVQSLKGLGADIAKTIKNSETKIPRADVEIKHTADIKDGEKTAVTDRLLMEGKTAQTGVEETKIYNSPHIFNDDIKNSELSKKGLLLKISTDIKEKEQGADPSKEDNTSNEKASQQDKEFINLKEAGMKIKASGTEPSSGKMIHMESDSKDNGTILPKNLSGDKSLEELLPGRENRLASNLSRAGTLNQIVEKAALNLKNGKSQVRIDLKPEFLGSVRMKITTENHLVMVRILTEFPVVKEMIENNISQLKTDLQSHGLEIDKLDVSVANDSEQQGKDFKKPDFLSQKENSDTQDYKTASDEEEGKVNLLRESTAENGLDFFA